MLSTGSVKTAAKRSASLRLGSYRPFSSETMVCRDT